MGGRGARPYPGKENYLLLDFSGCIQEHGFIDDEVVWNLDAKKPAAKKKVIRKKEKTILTCDMCHFAFAGKICPQCGSAIKDYGKKIEAIEAELVELKKPKIKEMTKAEKMKWFGMFEYIRREKGYASGWTAHKYREKTNVWPRGLDGVGPIPPDAECKNWIKYQQIKYAKRMKKAESLNENRTIEA
jgi:hypothetical protein